ncbi:hypothetical protein J2TS4_35960 [Paenibacillus sp. J2TS4]|nr:hypothetical protein J2TS4_35960 [Paenibacillus sp. J2TS4]
MFLLLICELQNHDHEFPIIDLLQKYIQTAKNQLIFEDRLQKCSEKIRFLQYRAQMAEMTVYLQ